MKPFLVFVLVGILAASCSNQRQFTYFKDIPDTIKNYQVPDTGFRSVTIKADDVLQVNISSPNPEATSFFLTQGANATTASGTSAATPNTYLVDQDGGIDLPLIGRVSVTGLTSVQAKNAIKTRVATYLKDPIVTVRLQNFKVTVLGEVARPANYIVPNERVSVLDALGMAGDLTIFGKRENVLVVRESGGKKTFVRLDLNKSEVFQSPYYYLQQNDIVYVEPNKARAASTDVTTLRNLSFFTTLATLAVVIVSRL